MSKELSMTHEEFKELARKILVSEATDDEIRLYNAWFNYFQKEGEHAGDVSENNKRLALRSIYQRIDKPIVPFWQPKRWLVAASILLVGASGLFLFRYKESQSFAARFRTDVAPGKSGATLLLAGGVKLDLNKISSEKAYVAPGIKISRTARGELHYEVQGKEGDLVNESHILTTSRGESVSMTLADGTKVWLNANSSLQFPASFKNLDSRDVILKGEAYFEVSKDKAHPFIVKTSRQQVKVLGTHFNISSYVNEEEVTTLLEGLVSVSRKSLHKVLKPSEEAVITESGIQVSPVDTSLAVSWKNGLIMFEREPLPQIMKMISRWYDVDIEYKIEKDAGTYTGSLARTQRVSEVLKLLEKSGGVKFTIRGRTIIVEDASWLQ